MSDFISRQTAVDALRESRLARNPVYMTTAMQVIEKLPSAQPEIEERTEEFAQNVPKEDLISRKAAIDALWEIRQKEISDGRRFHDYCSLSTAVDVIKDLPSAQPEPCEDAISRQAAIDALAKHEKSNGHNYTLFVDIVSECAEIIRDLPSAQPEPCKDAVSRADVVDMLEMFPFTEYSEYETAREVVKRLPSAQPEPHYCRECKWSRYYINMDKYGNTKTYWHCRNWDGGTDEEGYCYEWERKTDE